MTIFYFLSCLLIVASGAAAADTLNATPDNRTLTITSSLLAYNATRTIAFSSAVQLASSVQWQLEQVATTPAIPIPTNITAIPEYQAVSKLAPGLPIVQTGVEFPSAESMISDLISWSNVSSTRDSIAGRQSSLRVMIVGDSMSQGQQGDYTWRYRIWQWSQENDIAVDFVGPYWGTVSPANASVPQPPPLYGTTTTSPMAGTVGGYAQDVDSAFLSNCNHFAVWGRAAAVDKGLIEGVLQQNPADMMLLMLGFNDMGWFYSDAPGTIDSIETLVSNARAVNPNLKFAIANVPQRSFIGGRQDLVDNTVTYNGLLPGAISKLTTEQSPIYLVELEENYDCQPGGCPAGYDGLHPNAWGEYQIASAFSQTLVNNFGMGAVPLAVPDADDPSLVRDLPVPSNFQVFTSPQGVSATWDAVYGAYSYDIQVSVNGGANTFSPTTSSFNRWDCQWSQAGWTYAVSVRARAGDTRVGDYTATESAVAQPQLAPPPSNVVVTPTATGFTVTWDPPTGPYTDSIVEYNVIYWDWNPSDCQYLAGAAFKSSPAVIDGLTPGTNYLIAVVTWNENGQGWPFIAQNAVPGAGIPPVPGAPSVNSNDPTTVHITWSGSSSTGGYQVWSKNINQAGSEWTIMANVTESTCVDDYLLFPGVWNYAFALSAFNGNEESEMGPSSIAPSPASTVTEGSPGPTCPAAPSWCPGGATFTIPPEGGGGGSGFTTVIGGTTTIIGGQTTVVGGTTETLIVTTGTNSAGSVFTGTITEGSTSTSSATAGLTTYTTFPTSVSWSTTSVASNTHDSSGHPVLGPWPGCWFCPPGSNGIVLFGWPGPGVYPGGGPPAGLPTPFPPITIEPDDDPTYESTATSESCSTETATRITYYVSYGTDYSGSTVATETYSTYSSQVAGCTVSGTVATSTTAAGYAFYCTAGNCASCNARRDVPMTTAAAALPTATAGKGETKNLFHYGQNLTFYERDIPSSLYVDGISELYSEVRGAANTIQVPHDQTTLRGISSSRFSYFDASEFNLMVQGLRGCTSIVVVSRLGAYVTHFWEGPTFNNDGPSATFTADVIDYLQTGRSGGEDNTEPLGALVQGGVFGDTATTNIFIMTPAIMDLDLNAGTVGMAGTLANGNNPPLFGTSPPGNVDRLDTITTFLGQLMPGVPIKQFVYRRQTIDSLLANGAYGAAMVLYSNNQKDDPTSGDPLEPPQRAVWQCWMQGQLMGSDLWEALPGQTGSCPANEKRQAGSLCPSPTPTTTTTSTSATTTSTSSTPPPSSASPSSIILFSDSKCQDLLGSGTYDHYSSGCWKYDTPINSYIVGTTTDCGCVDSTGFCEWPTFVITTSTGCGYDDEVGGGCSGAGGQVPTGCYATTGPAEYITAELAYNGVCAGVLQNGTAKRNDEHGLELFDLEARVAGRINRRAPAC